MRAASIRLTAAVVAEVRRMYRNREVTSYADAAGVLGCPVETARELLAGSLPTRRRAAPLCGCCGVRRATHKGRPVWRCGRCFEGGRLDRLDRKAGPDRG